MRYPTGGNVTMIRDCDKCCGTGILDGIETKVEKKPEFTTWSKKIQSKKESCDSNSF